jgi:hypothetical protein
MRELGCLCHPERLQKRIRRLHDSHSCVAAQVAGRHVSLVWYTMEGGGGDVINPAGVHSLHNGAVVCDQRGPVHPGVPQVLDHPV